MTQDVLSPLADAELDRLETLLDTFPEAVDLEMLDGFLTALICSPEPVTISQYMPYVLGCEDSEIDQDLAQVQELYALIGRHWNVITGLLTEEGACEPLFIEYEDGLHGNSWALGFMHGMALGGEAWTELLDDDDQGDMLMPILVLAHEADPDPETRPGPIGPEDREMLFEGIAAAVPGVFAYFEPHRRGEAVGAKPNGGTLRSVPKLGRNAPCPCGSGKKYKGCCGKN